MKRETRETKEAKMKTLSTGSKGLPKFNTTGWLSVGVLFSLVLFADSLWAAIARWDVPFFPFQFANILGMIVGLGLGVHCVDMIFYNKKQSKT
jgi:hypothetical protein